MSTLLITTIVLSLQPPPTPALETNEVEPRQPGSSAVQVCQASTWCGGWSRYRNCSDDWSTLQIQSPDQQNHFMLEAANEGDHNCPPMSVLCSWTSQTLSPSPYPVLTRALILQGDQ